jgi:outer membrane protein OmpA-like peptidoglycan-associated protein
MCGDARNSRTQDSNALWSRVTGMCRRAEVEDQRFPFERQIVMQFTRPTNPGFVLAPALALGVSACATTHQPPAELLQARTAYTAAQDGKAWNYDRAGLRNASSALAKAESSFQKEGNSEATRKQAHVALVRAEEAEIDGSMNARVLAEQKAEIGQTSVPKGTVTLAAALFPTGQSRLPAEARDRLDQLAVEVIGHEDASIRIRGHADSTGSESENMVLSAERANQVADYLSSLGVPIEQMVVDAVGDREPLASARGADALNRRVQLVAFVPAEDPTER